MPIIRQHLMILMQIFKAYVRKSFCMIFEMNLPSTS